MSQSIKIVIPTAGYGTRLRPHTWSKPKPLVALAGKTVVDYVLAQFDSLPQGLEKEYIFIIGPNGWEVKTYLDKHYPDCNAHFVVQEDMRGQSHAIHLAKEHLRGPMMMTFSDTLIETDLSQLEKETLDGIAWVKQVPDPRRFGAARLDANGHIAQLIEKPTDMQDNLVVVGFYYFKSSEALMDAIEEQIRLGITLKGEYFLVDAINILLSRGANFGVTHVDTWLDAGIPESVLETNRYLLEHGHDNNLEAARQGVELIPPVYIHPKARVEDAVIGPHVSIAAGCHIQRSVLSNSILDENCHIEDAHIENSLLGRQVKIKGLSGKFNLGDHSWAESSQKK